MALEVLEFTFLILAIVFSIIAIEQTKLIRAVMGLMGVTVSIGILFLLLGAYQLAILQLLIYAGGVIALFIVVILLTRGVEE